MERKKKLKRAAILSVFIYIMINGFIWGFMKAYMNSHNIFSNEHLAMAEVQKSEDKTEIKILNKNFSIDKNKTAENTAGILLYILMPDKVRTSTELIMLYNTLSQKD